MTYYDSMVLLTAVSCIIMFVVTSSNNSFGRNCRTAFFSIYFLVMFGSGCEWVCNFFLLRLFKNIELVLFLALVGLYGYVLVGTFRGNKQQKNTLVLVLLLILLLIGVSVQFFCNVKALWLTACITSIFLFVYYTQTVMDIDILTGLLNQNAYKNFLRRLDSPGVFLLFDVDSFKTINDSYGHQFGDIVLNCIGECIQKTYASFGYCFRIGGDEFCVFLRKGDAKQLNSCFVAKLQECRKTEPRIPYVSIGSACYNPGYHVLDILDQADKDLYHWKEILKAKRALDR